MFRGSTRLQIRTLVCFRNSRFQGLLLVLSPDRYFHLLWLQFDMRNPAIKRGHASPSGDTPGKNPAKTATAGKIEENLVPVRIKATSGHL